MNYTFKNADNNFSGFSTVYNVYDDENLWIASIVVGYCMLNHIFFYTEYKGGRSDRSIGIETQEEFNSILYDFSQIFEYMDYLDIFSNESYYYEHESKVPQITKDNLYIYDAYGEVFERDDRWSVIPDDDYVEYLVNKGILEGTQFLLEDYDDEDNLYVNLEEDGYYSGDSLDGFFLYVKDWNALEQEVFIHNI